jgi:hypothetical protein
MTMGLFELAMIVSAVVALYNFQQIKITLKDKGYPVEMLKGWLEDYRRFKGLIEKEPDHKTKINYQKIINGLHFSLLGLVVFIALILRRHM